MGGATKGGGGGAAGYRGYMRPPVAHGILLLSPLSLLHPILRLGLYRRVSTAMGLYRGGVSRATGQVMRTVVLLVLLQEVQTRGEMTFTTPTPPPYRSCMVVPEIQDEFNFLVDLAVDWLVYGLSSGAICCILSCGTLCKTSF